MKKQLLLAGLFLLSLCALAQNSSNLFVFSEDGDLFYAYVNGVRQNDKPEANVRITGLTFPNLSLRIEFENKALPQLKQNMVLEPGREHSAKIVRDTKKQVKLRYFGDAPIDNSAAAGSVTYHSAENPKYNVAGDSNTNTNTNTTNSSSTGSGNTTVTGYTTTTTQTTGNPGNASMNITMGGAGISMNMSGMDPNAQGNTITTTSSTTVTSSSSSSGSSSSSDAGYGRNEDHRHHRDHKNNTGTNNTNNSYSGCGTAMSPGSFATMKQSIASKPFSDTKMSTARAATKNACLSVNQIKEICKLFNMDDEKLAYAKFAYDYAADKANYYQVSDVFSFSSTTEELNKFLEQR